MNRGKIIVVEGPSNSGKTTTCQNMKNYADCIVIDECMIYEKILLDHLKIMNKKYKINCSSSK